MSKLNVAFVRCLHPIENVARKSYLSGWNNIQCGGLVHNTPEHREAHASDLHGTKRGKFSHELPEEHGNECRVARSTRDRCDCGNSKSPELNACATCQQTEREKARYRVVEGKSTKPDPEERRARINELRLEKRAQLRAAGICTSCYREPTRGLGARCAKCSERRGQRRSSPALPPANVLASPEE